ncbi:ribosome small subunit-dependent GTPase A [Actinoallomurus spadix]|uniref:Small ribosomal subunit biogenesis GTPase RsgA n=1 Tax=Actinoallomurus spadix TaxID=79912 RepID=A0ABP3GAZ9_9ACTN|nr:ribosome small subunit-dependent GTPase A [Actinoallomurus spadix]MCO5989865.1 ribosome small subunit-dependent GTPase A [Actinoallomurus spadix]
MSSTFPDPVSPSPEDVLRAYGWGEADENTFTAHRSAGLSPGRVARVDRGHVTVVTANGWVRAVWSAPAGAPPAASPCTGDWAAVRLGARPELAALLPRRTAIVRSSASRTSHAQVLAANVDTVVVVVSLAASAPAGRIERMLALAWESGAVPVIVLTNADRPERPITVVRDEVAALAPGVDTLPVSSVTGEGMDVLTASLTGTIVLLGPSGAGKSTLGNALLGADLLATGEVRARDGKGRHTTVHRELIRLPGGGVLIDTPGLRAVGLHDSRSGIEQVFAEIEDLAADCRFSDCGHVSEPGCAVRAAITAGDLPQRRLDSYRKLLRESDWAASREDARLRTERDNQRKAISRHLRATYRFRNRQS